MANFPEQWMKDICDELNIAGITIGTDLKTTKWDSSNFENSIEFMKNYVTLSSSIYEHLNSKGLVNRGYCPITGEKIDYKHVYQIFGRKVYISARGEQLCKEWDREEHIKIFGKEPMSEGEKGEKVEKFMAERAEKKKGRTMVFLIIVIAIIFIIKKC